ncbi:MAG: hypothetical protein ING36_01505 [Burkholderiales bacterium]|nr:hypothetical protein [Burkholderiales bacterium]
MEYWNSSLKRLISHFFLVTPRVANIIFTLFFAPLFFKLWGDEYSIYITVSMLGGFAAIVAQPVIVRYYQANHYELTIAAALIAFVFLYAVFMSVPVGFYLYRLDNLGESLFSGILFPLVTGALLIARSSYFRYERQKVSALCETMFLITKIPLGYLLAYSEILKNVNSYILYFVFCCCVEVLVLAAYASDSSRLSRSSIMNLGNIFSQKYQVMALVAAIAIVDVLLGNLDRVMLTAFRSPNDLILYSFSLTVATVLYVLPAQINTQSQGKYHHLRSDEDAWQLIGKNMSDLALVAVLPCFIYFILGEWLTTLWLGRVLDLHVLQNVYKCSCVLMVGAVLNSFCGPFSNYLQSRGRFGWVCTSTALSVMVFFALLLFAIQMPEIIYIAVAATLTHLFKFMLICMVALKQRSRERTVL